MSNPDKITEIRKALERFTEYYKELKSVGINQEILESYLAAKTRLSMKSIKAILESQDEFYNNLITNAAVDAL